jgi:hypothetical protein
MLKLVCWNPIYTGTILNWKNIAFDRVGELFRHKDQTSNNLIIDINQVFSTKPKFEPIDRTLQTVSPYRIYVSRPWKIPQQQFTLDHALEQRVKKLALSNKKINVFWSGGIDSTATVTAFLKHLTNLSQLRILYSPYSTYEHPGYVDFLKNFPQIELVDISGEIYLNDQFDGIFVTGDGGDELNASLDESFFDQYGYNHLHSSWQDFFYKQTQNSNFVEQCQQHFLAAGRPIETVLEARWWFYTTCKNRSVLNLKLPWLFNYKNFAVENIVGFYDCEEFENYIYWNIDSVIDKSGYHTWKQPLKDYCFAFDNMENWRKNKVKELSGQMISYLAKKLVLNDQRWIAILSDGTRITTPSLPVLTRKEFEITYANTLDWIFHASDKV